MDYNVSDDMKAVREILGITQNDLASYLGVQQITVSRTESRETKASENLLERFYGFAVDNNIKLGKLKEMLWSESIDSSHKLIFHGAKSEIVGSISVTKSRFNNDFGQGFYTGESYDQAVSFVCGFDKPSVYYIDFDESGLKCKRYHVDQEWMLTIAYHRGTLNKYKDHPIIKKLAEESGNCDYIIAPIADNRMFQIINTFISGEITDEQCKHCLAATNLGNQYIFIKDAAVKNLNLLERTYIPANERGNYMKIRDEYTKLGDDKVRLARIQFRGKGRYIDEILV